MAEFKEFYNKKTGEKVSFIRGYDVITAYYETPECTLFGRRIKRYPSPIVYLGNVYEIERVGVIHGNDYIAIKGRNDIEILGEEEFERLYSKHPVNKTEFLKIEKENETSFIRFNSIRLIGFSTEGEKSITIVHTKGMDKLTCNSVLNFDEVKEVLENYVEREIG